MSISNSPTPQVRVRTPRRLGVVQKIWRLGDRWMSTLDHDPHGEVGQIQIYPIETLRPNETRQIQPAFSHVVRRDFKPRRPFSLVRCILSLIPLAIPVVLVGLAWLNGWGL